MCRRCRCVLRNPLVAAALFAAVILLFLGVATPVAVAARAAPRVARQPAFPPLPPIAYLTPAPALVVVAVVVGTPRGCTDAPAVVANILSYPLSSAVTTPSTSA